MTFLYLSHKQLSLSRLSMDNYSCENLRDDIEKILDKKAILLCKLPKIASVFPSFHEGVRMNDVSAFTIID